MNVDHLTGLMLNYSFSFSFLTNTNIFEILCFQHICKVVLVSYPESVIGGVNFKIVVCWMYQAITQKKQAASQQVFLSSLLLLVHPSPVEPESNSEHQNNADNALRARGDQ